MVEATNESTDFNDEDRDIDEEIEATSEEINQPFDPLKIRVGTRKITIDSILKRIEYNELDLTPDFQRYDNIWTNEAKSKLIESILIRIPLPAFYIDATNDDKWLVIDGLQRLTTLKQFAFEKNLKLTGLQYLTDLENKNYDQLSRKYQRRILETELILSTIEPGTPPAVKYNIFRRINTGGIPLSPQEIRHALNQGKSTKFLAHLAKLTEFTQVTHLDKSKKKERMIDQEFILGFLAYSIYGYKKYHEFESRDIFFVETMTFINQMFSDKDFKEIENKFKKSMIAAHKIFGENAFRKIPKKTSRRSPINQALFEAWSVTLSKLDDSQIERLKNRRNDLIDKFSELADNDNEFFKSISQATEKVEVRFRNIENLVREVLA